MPVPGNTHYILAENLFYIVYVHCRYDTKGIKTLSSDLSLAKVGNMFPNIKTIFELLLTLPVGSCSCEHLFSAMQRLKTWQRSTMGESRSNGLALMNIHSNNDVGQIGPNQSFKTFRPNRSSSNWSCVL